MQKLAGSKELFDDHLRRFLNEQNQRAGIWEACAYSLNAGGKRIRPILAILACEACGGEVREALPAALAVEMIHTFSLIHDDLPAIDNDDLRRGQATCHRKFGEAAAILAGDTLIFKAYEVINRAGWSPAVKNAISLAMAQACAEKGLIQGEYADILAEGKDIDSAQVIEIYRGKTARLFELCTFCGARIATDDPAVISAWGGFGLNLGLAFQAIDDILDVTADADTLGKTAGKDLVQEKATLVKIMGVTQTKEWARQATVRALETLTDYDNAAGMALRGLALNMIDRIM